MNPACAFCTPISVQFIPEPLITWADLWGVRFAEPFFRLTVERLAKDRWKALTGIEDLRALDDRPTLAPSLFIFQVSRCGSTLLSQMLATSARNVVISEANIIGEILSARLAPAETAELLRLTIRALGRNHGPDARHLILKFNSWNVLRAEVIHALFPDTPLVWLQRDPLEVLASHAEGPAGWTAWQGVVHSAVSSFGLTVEEARAMSAGHFRLHAIGALYRAVSASRLPWLVVDYRELPDALWERIGPHAGLSWDASEMSGMRERARFDSKAEVNGPFDRPFDRPFVARDRSASLSDEERRFIAQRIDPLYRAIGH
jgi:hypothetical protein